MGRDKAEIVYAQLPQWRALEEILRPLCADVFWSCTPTQQAQWGIGNRAIVDVVAGHGPASGLLAAFTKTVQESITAWLVVGCDYPILETGDLQS